VGAQVIDRQTPCKADPRPQICVELRGVGKSFQNSEAVSDVSLRVATGSFTALVGPTGCGKSTLLNLVAGLETPTLGEVHVCGRKICGPTEGAALIFQDSNLFPWLTAIENVALAFKKNGLGKEEARAEARRLLGNVGLGSVAHKVPAQLSGGMKQRVALVRAFALKPHLLLMDEPFAALDYQTRKMMQSYLLSTWRNTGATVIMVTHDLDEALYLADCIVLMSGSPGTVSDVMDIPIPHPRSKENRTLVQSYKRLEAHLKAEAARGEFTEEELEAMREFRA
jgi:NitT/TauT family transport system ATP-binding protein